MPHLPVFKPFQSSFLLAPTQQPEQIQPCNRTTIENNISKTILSPLHTNSTTFNTEPFSEHQSEASQRVLPSPLSYCQNQCIPPIPLPTSSTAPKAMQEHCMLDTNIPFITGCQTNSAERGTAYASPHPAPQGCSSSLSAPKTYPLPGLVPQNYSIPHTVLQTQSQMPNRSTQINSETCSTFEETDEMFCILNSVNINRRRRKAREGAVRSGKLLDTNCAIDMDGAPPTLGDVCIAFVRFTGFLLRLVVESSKELVTPKPSNGSVPTSGENIVEFSAPLRRVSSC